MIRKGSVWGFVYNIGSIKDDTRLKTGQMIMQPSMARICSIIVK